MMMRGGKPMKKNVDATMHLSSHQAATSLLLRHCLSIGTAEERIPARTRLDEAIGPDLARRLVTSLTARSPRREPFADGT
jgi:hypothetical protein